MGRLIDLRRLRGSGWWRRRSRRGSDLGIVGVGVRRSCWLVIVQGPPQILVTHAAVEGYCKISKTTDSTRYFLSDTTSFVQREPLRFSSLTCQPHQPLRAKDMPINARAEMEENKGKGIDLPAVVSCPPSSGRLIRARIEMTPPCLVDATKDRRNFGRSIGRLRWRGDHGRLHCIALLQSKRRLQLAVTVH